MFNKERIKEFITLFHSLELSWQIYSLVLIYLIITITALFLRWEVGLMLLLLLLIALLVLALNYENFIRSINTLAKNLSDVARHAQEESMYRSPMGILLYDQSQEHRVKWVNPSMQQIFGTREILGKPLLSISEDFATMMDVETDQQWHVVNFMNRHFRVLHQGETQAFYMMDVSEEMAIREEKQYDQVVMGYLFLDDYNEIVESMDDQQRSQLNSEIIHDIGEWASQYGIYTKRIEPEKFFLLLNQHVLEQLEKTKFKYFDDLKDKNLLRNTPLSISIGLAYSNHRTYRLQDLAEQAQSNLDLALGRGGDQIVVKSDSDRARFYGAKTNPTQKRSNIRSRLVFQALKTAMEQADQILVVGHKTPDMDSIGSAIGIYKLAKQFRKRANVILNFDELNADIQELLAMPQASVLKERNVLIDIEQAKELATDNTLLVMVDHHRPSLSEAESLLEDLDVVIIDHHRRGESMPPNVVLTYIEPYASSTAELITEFFMGMRNTTEALNMFESTALLAGIIVDTNNFSSRTGSRTFDAASYLKSRGADTTQIQRLLKESLDTVVHRNQLIERTEMVRPGYAVIQGDVDEVVDNITAAQTADILLDIKDVEASFVIYQRSPEVVGISARSLGSINVQMIMERMGGGGHLSNAATQLEDTTIQTAYEQLVQEIQTQD